VFNIHPFSPRRSARCRAALVAAAILGSASIALASETSTYNYDALGRLTSVARAGGPNSGTQVSTAFDAAGNRSAHGGAAPSGVSLSVASNGPVAEGVGATFTIFRSGTPSGSLTVNYATASGTASSGSDFTAASGTLTFQTTDSSLTLTVPTSSDGQAENEEQFSLTLSAPSAGVTLGVSTALATILGG
jgi:YD repeat-containing protein